MGFASHHCRKSDVAQMNWQMPSTGAASSLVGSAVAAERQHLKSMPKSSVDLVLYCKMVVWDSGYEIHGGQNPGSQRGMTAS